VKPKNYIPGEGCRCSARNEYECGCCVDWTPTQIYVLREQLAAERALADRLASSMEQMQVNWNSKAWHEWKEERK
jgi:hypothetical protein